MSASISHSKKHTTGIYAIVNKTNGKIYIGSSENVHGRWRSHRFELRRGDHHCKHLQSAWNKYGPESFYFILLEECHRDSLIQREQYYLDHWKPEYNSSPVAGNNGGYRFTDEEKARMSVVHTGFRHTEESKRKMSEIWSGRPRGKYSEERAAKISKAHKGKKPNENQAQALKMGRNSKSAETRKKISDAQKGYQPTEETREKLRQAWVRRKARKSDELQD